MGMLPMEWIRAMLAEPSFRPLWRKELGDDSLCVAVLTFENGVDHWALRVGYPCYARDLLDGVTHMPLRLSNNHRVVAEVQASSTEFTLYLAEELLMHAEASMGICVLCGLAVGSPECKEHP